MKNALGKTLTSVKREGKVPFSSEGERVAGVHPGYCIAYGRETGGPFFKDKCAIVEIELAEPA